MQKASYSVKQMAVLAVASLWIASPASAASLNYIEHNSAPALDYGNMRNAAVAQDKSAQEKENSEEESRAEQPIATNKNDRRIRGRINRAGRPGNGAGPRPKRPWTYKGKINAEKSDAGEQETRRVRGRINRYGHPGQGAGPRPVRPWIKERKSQSSDDSRARNNSSINNAKSTDSEDNRTNDGPARPAPN